MRLKSLKGFYMENDIKIIGAVILLVGIAFGGTIAIIVDRYAVKMPAIYIEKAQAKCDDIGAKLEWYALDHTFECDNKMRSKLEAGGSL